MQVIDSSAIAAIVTEEREYEKLMTYLKDGFTVDLAFKECLNVVWKKAYIFKEDLNLDSALRKIKLLRKILTVLDQNDYLERSLDISMQHGIAVYDSIFLAAALEENLALVTLDDKQRKVAEVLGIELV